MNRSLDSYKHMREKVDEYLKNMDLSQEMRAHPKLSLKTTKEVRIVSTIEPIVPIWRKPNEFFQKYSPFAIIPVIKTGYQTVSKCYFKFEINEPKNTFQNIKKLLKTTGKSEVQVLSEEFKLSLICPISAKRIVFPARFENCKHIECFDLETLLNVNIGKNYISCPICQCSNSQPLSIRDINQEIKIDGFLLRILSSIQSSCHSIIFDKSGYWRKGNTNCDKELNNSIVSKEFHKSVNTKSAKSKIEVIVID